MPDFVGEGLDGILTMQATIANGASLSNVLAPPGLHLVGIQMPATWTAAGITFLANADGGNTLQSVFDNSGNEVVVTAVQAHYVVIPPTLIPRIQALQVRSGTIGVPVNQGQQSILTLLFAKYS